MMSNRSFFNTHLLRETMRRNVWAVALSFVGFFFCLPLPVAMIIQQGLARIEGMDPTQQAQVRGSMTESVRMMLSMDNQFVKVGMIIMGVVCGIALFSYLHSRQRVDFYHALPVRRSALFVNHYLAGALTVLPAFVIMYALAAVIAVAMGVPEAFSIGQGVLALVVHGLFFLLIYAVSALAAILTGNTILAVLLNAWLMFSPAAAIALYAGLGSMFLRTWSDNHLLDLALHTSPILLYFNTTSGVRYGILAQETPLLPTLLGVLISIILVTILAFVLFRRRKSESAGVAVAFQRLKAPLKCYMVLLIALAFGIIMSGIGGDFWIWFGLLAGTALGHIIIEMIYHIDVRAAFANAKTMIVLGLVAIAVVAGMKADVFGYDRWLPRENQVQAVGFYAWVETGPWYGELGNRAVELTDPASIAAVLELAETGIAGLETYEDVLYHQRDIWVSYKLGGGRTAERHYRIEITDEIWELFNQIRFTEEYIRGASPLFTFDLEAAGESTALEIRTAADSYDRVATLVHDPAQVREVIDTLREESLGLTAEVATETVPALRMDIRYTVDRPDHSYETRLEYIPIYPSYTRTLALLEQYGGVVPRALTADDLREITISTYGTFDYDEKYSSGEMVEIWPSEPDGQMEVVLTDRAEIEAFLQNAVTEAMVRACDAGLALEGNEKYTVHARYENNQSIQLYYREGSFPEALCEAYFAATR